MFFMSAKDLVMRPRDAEDEKNSTMDKEKNFVLKHKSRVIISP